MNKLKFFTTTITLALLVASFSSVHASTNSDEDQSASSTSPTRNTWLRRSTRSTHLADSSQHGREALSGSVVVNSTVSADLSDFVDVSDLASSKLQINNQGEWAVDDLTSSDASSAPIMTPGVLEGTVEDQISSVIGFLAEAEALIAKLEKKVPANSSKPWIQFDQATLAQEASDFDKLQFLIKILWETENRAEELKALN